MDFFVLKKQIKVAVALMIITLLVSFCLPTSSFAEEVTELWVRRYNGNNLGVSQDLARAMVVDGNGNVYVTGQRYRSGTPADYVTIKYDSAGNELWVKRYNGSANDWANAIAVDVSGNVYVTGASEGSGTSTDYATIKYDPSGNELWVKRYNGPANYSDWAIAVAVDGNGNVYVTGASDGSGTFDDYATIKYDSAGNELWVKRYNGPANGGDYASAMAVDEGGNVYVTGGTDTTGTASNDYATIKYDSAGNELWVKIYIGPGNDWDFARAITLDGNGNVYVTGYSYGNDLTSNDYATIKYDSAGNELWVKRYNGPGTGEDRASAIALDGNGNVYVTGESVGSETDGSTDYATIKYDSAGNELWVKRYNGPANSWDRAFAIAADGSGNVYVTGGTDTTGTDASTDYATIKYDSAGNELWVKRYNGPANGADWAGAIVIDGNGNVYVTGYSVGNETAYDYATIEYDSAGNERWVRRYNDLGNNLDGASAIAVDGSGNIYVTGTSYGDETFTDYATIKYDSSGNELWVKRYNGSGNNRDFASAIAVDESGNLYVTGASYGSGTSYDYATIKYDSAGNVLWVKRYNGSGNGEDWANAVAVDGSGNIYVTGLSVGSGTSYDSATIKYDSAGNELWVKRYNGPANDWDFANAIAVDGASNIYVTGESYGSGTSADYATIKYDSSGNELWVKRYNGPGNGVDWANALAVDGSGNIYVTGLSVGSGTSYDSTTIKYDSAGNELWVKRYNGPANNWDFASAIALDGSGNVYVAGVTDFTVSLSGISADYATIKYDSAGNELWVRRYNGPSNGWDGASAIALDGKGNVYVTGNSNGSGTLTDYATIKYDSAGNELWVQRYNGPVNGVDFANAIAADGNGNVYVTGESYGGGTSTDYATIKYESKEEAPLPPPSDGGGGTPAPPPPPSDGGGGGGGAGGGGAPAPSPAPSIQEVPAGYGTIAGRLLNTAGQVIPDATIRVDNIPVTFDIIDGHFIAGLIPVGVHTVYYDAPGYISQTQVIEIKKEQTTNAPTCLLSPNTGDIVGRVISSYGEAIPGTVVRINVSTMPTNPAGEFRFTQVVPGIYTIYYDAPGYIGQTQVVQVLARIENRPPTVILSPAPGTRIGLASRRRGRRLRRRVRRRR